MFYGMLSGMSKKDVKKKADEYLQIVEYGEMAEYKNRRNIRKVCCKTRSCTGTLDDPSLCLDEPTDGVDPYWEKTNERSSHAFEGNR